MAEVTVTYSPTTESWTSFWSYIPDWMTGMNNNFYSWRNGSLYKHNENPIRNQFYIDDVPQQDGEPDSVNYPSTMTTIFNDDAFAPKVFKTISMYSTDPWDVDVETDLNTGRIESAWFKPKEGHWFAFIRRDENEIDLKAVSTQGLGRISDYNALTLSFSFNIGTAISQGDTIYKESAGVLTQVGVVASHTQDSITLVSAAITPAPGDMIVYVKNSTSESFGPRGYYMQATLRNKSENYVGLFHLNTNSFLSFPT